MYKRYIKDEDWSKIYSVLGNSHEHRSKELSKRLMNTHGKRFSESNLRNMRQFYLEFQRPIVTDVIAHEQLRGTPEPWKQPKFIDTIIALQRQRQSSCSSTNLQFYDRSPLCTYALAVYLGYEPSATMIAEIARIEGDKIYEKRVFFVENLGFCQPTEARKISYEQSLVFERTHLETYDNFVYECVRISPAPLDERAAKVLTLL